MKGVNELDIQALLNHKGLKNTPGRRLILECLCEAKQPLTAEQIFMSLRGQQASTCLSTVYRNVETLCSMQVVEKAIILDDGKARYALSENEHKHHVSCMACHKIVAIDACPFEAVKNSLKGAMDFQIVGHKFEIYGYCKNCADNMGKQNTNA